MDSAQPAGTGAERDVDVTAVTWAPRRTGWMGRPPSRARVEPPKSEPMPAVDEDTGLIVPTFPAFSPAAIAALLQQSRQSVYYWITCGKIEFFRDNIGEPYILRAELVRFIREYLHREVRG